MERYVVKFANASTSLSQTAIIVAFIHHCYLIFSIIQALFRPIAMMVPDYKLIAEVILYSEGFESSKILAQKMVQMYKLCSEQVCIHYSNQFYIFFKKCKGEG